MGQLYADTNILEHPYIVNIDYIGDICDENFLLLADDSNWVFFVVL